MRACSYCHQLLSEADAVCPRDGREGIEARLAAVPSQLRARFPAIEPFACGGTGSSFLAVQAQSGYRGLLKILSPEVAASPQERTRLKRELRKQTALASNGLVRLIDGGEVGSELWLFRDFVQGESLAVCLRQSGVLPVPEALAVTAQIASALDELHRQGLLHRDVKPGHVLLTTREGAVPLVTLIDAGLAARLPTDLVFESIGTAAYIAPEIVAGKQASFRSDLYALGCVLYEMLTGRPPFVAESVDALLAAHRDAEPDLQAVDLPAPVRALLVSMLAKEPRRRPFSAGQVRRVLDPHLPDTTPKPSHATRTPAGASSPVKAGGVPSSSDPMRSSAPRVPAVHKTEEIDLDAISEADEGDEAWPEVETEEIDLTELVGGSTPPRAHARANQTQELSAADLTELSPPAAGPASVSVTQEPAALALTTGAGATSQPTAAAPNHAADSGDTPLDGVSGAASEAMGDHASNTSPDDAVTTLEFVPGAATASSPPPKIQQAPEASGEPPPGHALDFDVESLFDDELAAASTATPASMPPSASTLDRKSSRPPESARPVAQVASTPPSAAGAHDAASGADHDYADHPSHPHDESPWVSDPEGTALIRRPRGLGTKRPWPLFAGAAILLLVVLVFAWGGGEGDDRGNERAAPAHGSISEQATKLARRAETERNALDREATTTERGEPSQAPAHVEPTTTEATSLTTTMNDTASRAPSAPGGSAATGTGSRRASGPVPVPYKPPARSNQGADHKAKARELYQAGKYREAAEAYERATQQSPSDAGAFAGLGASWLAAGQPGRAILAYQRAIQLQPQVSGFHAALGRAYLQKGDRGRAAAAYRKALALDPNNVAAKNGLQNLGS